MGAPHAIGQLTLRAHSDFQRVFAAKTRLFRGGLGFCYRKAFGVEFHFGVSIPKRFGKAVERNKVRRRLKEIVRTSTTLPGSLEIVFCVSRPCCELTYEILKETCEWAFARIARVKLPDPAVSSC